MDFQYLRLNLIDDYNNEMGDVDRTDQLRGSYRPDVWIKKTKWWFAWFIWCLGNLTVNSYQSYRRFMSDEGVKKKKIKSQYDYRYDIVQSLYLLETYVQKSNKRYDYYFYDYANISQKTNYV